MKVANFNFDYTNQDYYPFGMLAVGRSWESGSGDEYRFGFNGKESDNEAYDEGNIYDYGFRIYNPRLGKFLSMDPYAGSYSWYTPYQFAGNKVIVAVDLDGLEEYIVHYFYNEHGMVTRMQVMTYRDVKGKSQDMEVRKSNDHIENRKVLVLHSYENGTPYKDPTYQDELTKAQLNVLDKRRTGGHNLSPNGPHKTQGDELGGWESKTFSDGYFILAQVDLDITIDPSFKGNSDEFASETEKDKIDILGDIMQLIPESTVVLAGNTGTDLGNPGKLPLGGGPDVLSGKTELNGKPTSTGELMKARAQAVAKVLIEDFGIDMMRITTTPGIQTDKPSGRNVHAQISIH